MSTLIFGLWGLRVLLQAFLVTALVRKGLARKYPVLMAWAAVGAAKGMYLAYLYNAYGFAAYKAWWRNSQNVEIVLLSILTIDAIYQIASHFGAAAKFTTWACGICSLVAALVISQTLGLWTAPWEWMRQGLLALTRHIAAGCLLVYLPVWLYTRVMAVQWRTNARLYHWAICAVMVAQVSGFGLLNGKTKNYWVIAAAQITLAVGPLIGCLVWSRMDSRGEDYTRPSLADIVRLQRPFGSTVSML